MSAQQLLADWHAVFDSKDASKLAELLADDAVMISPVVHTPQEGKMITHIYLSAAMHVFANEHFQYKREFVGDNAVVLEFETQVNGIYVNGVDMITCNDEGKITEFRVMVRPLKALNTIHEMMGQMLNSMK